MKKILLIIVVVAIAGVIVSNLPYFQELRAYNKVCEEPYLFLCDEYLEEYPDGRHADDVCFMKIERSDKEMSSITEYLERFPDGKFADRANAICDSIWDAEIAKYDSRDKSLDSPEAVAYMGEMLQYMKKNRINTLVVEANSTLKLKDYDEYDESVRTFLEILNDSKLTIADHMISLKRNFTSGSVSSLTNILKYGVAESMNRMFSEDFIEVKDLSSCSENLANVCPRLTFDCVISSQEETVEGYVFPHIWVYSEFDVPKNYLIGISVDFDAKFTIPGSDVTYTYKERGEPGENIDSIEDISDGYRQMTAICFTKFSDKMAANLGLAELAE